MAIEIRLPEEFDVWLEEIASLQVLGESAGEVAVHLLREAIAREMRAGGLLHAHTTDWMERRVAAVVQAHLDGEDEDEDLQRHIASEQSRG